jgi:hypothetical protein
MSKVFSNTTTKDGLIQIIERNCGFNDGEVSGNATLLAQFTGDINASLDKVFSIIFSAGGTWQFDDTNHTASTGYPQITANLVSGTRTYSFTADADANLLLEIYKVFIADSTGLFREIQPVDVQSYAPVAFTDGLNTTGIPNTYDKTGKYITLDPIPNYNYTAGLKVLINREGSYFTTADTTKKPGFAGIFHEYLALRPSYFYCMRNQKPIANKLKEEMLELEAAIEDHYAKREKDVQKTLTGKRNKCR